MNAPASPEIPSQRPVEVPSPEISPPSAPVPEISPGSPSEMPAPRPSQPEIAPSEPGRPGETRLGASQAELEAQENPRLDEDGEPMGAEPADGTREVCAPVGMPFKERALAGF